ncbi:hypothetical protein [Paraburkholderia sp. BCC1885]|uniref:hypothetical protein n=1 Tax=Paraburkholderia sp. BCC1885 TaxID=2562669 RepID=UPI001181F61E|nr:hypothetical protein [Paraburkholderia sp. BCC1885]
MGKEMLLPIAADFIRQKSLEHHLALATLRSGRGGSDTVGRLFHCIYVAYFVREATIGRFDLNVFRAAEAALHEMVTAAKGSGVYEISGDGCIQIEHVLAMHDRQLATIPRHVIENAQKRLDRFLSTDDLSPIASA